MKKNLFWILFILVFLFGFFVRFYRLGGVPNSLDWDEVSQGYNAYSILQTGKDEYGVAYPLTIRSFNDYKTPVYVYLTIPSVGVFGLNPLSARFPSAFFGTLSILLVFGFSYELFKKTKYTKEIALLSMFFFSISPLSIQFSRTGFDANIGVFFVLLGSWIFVRYVAREKFWPLFAAVFFLGLSAYTAHSEKIFSPLFFVILLIYGRRFLVKKKILSIILILFFVFLNSFWLLDSQTRVRSGGVLFTSSLNDSFEEAANRIVFDKNRGDGIDAMLHNRRLVYIDKYFENYLSHFDLNSLFIYGDNARHHTPGMGILYLASFPLILLGFFYILRRKVYMGFVVFAWVFIAPIASGFAIDAPNYQRSLIFLPSFQILEAIGVLYLFLILRDKKYSKIYIGLLIFLLSANIFYYMHQYFFHTDVEYAKYWQYGYKEAIDYTNKNFNKSKIFFDNNIEQAYMFYLFYNNYSPEKYLVNGGSNKINNDCYSIDNAYFGKCVNKKDKDDIYVTSEENSSSNLRLINVIKYPNGENSVFIYRIT